MFMRPIFSFLLIITALCSTAGGSTSTFQSIEDGQTIVSTTGNFELGFFSPSTVSNDRYLGIWYKKSSTTVVWVANREAPLNDSSGVLQLTDSGILILYQNKSIIWFSNTSRSSENPVSMLLDSGNLVVSDGIDSGPEKYLWQSFDYPSDTLLPGMKLGWNRSSGLNRILTSWRSSQDPSLGMYTYELGRRGYAEGILKKGSVVLWRTGPWTGVGFSGLPHLTPNPLFSYKLVFDDHDEEYYIFTLRNSSIYSRVTVTSDGRVLRYTWVDSTQSWRFNSIYQTSFIDNCDYYAFCGPNGACSIDSSRVCSCLKGFAPKNPKDWDTVDWSDGCVRSTPLNSVNCSADLFKMYSSVKLPDTEHSWFNRSMSLEECKTMCLKNCSCTAYANLDIRNNGTGCLLWFSDLVDIRNYSLNGQDIYIRMAASELEGLDHDNTATKGNDSKSKKVLILCVTLLLTGVVILCIVLVLYLRKQQHKKYGMMRGSRREDSEFTSREDIEVTSKKEDFELPLFDLATIVGATDNFSENSKLGEGGFGSVFQGMLRNGQQIAVKRLSKNSTQGLDEFKNEVTHIVKLQHRNLVKLLGCCIQEDEMMLIYEFLPNKSLDFFIFDEKRSFLLDWPKRFDIINGIARGILYLHQDSRLRVIHRDLKAGNILLDSEFNPKISDFGLARSFGGNETKAETNKIVGTYGYMSPEYAIDGFYSTKSDVYSFGVLILEMISGRRNRGFLHPGHKLNLLGHAWNLHIEDRSIELVATTLGDSVNLQEALRTIHVGLLCVQQNPLNRPSMSAAVLMLSAEGLLPEPEKPGFYNERALTDLQVDPSSQGCSVNVLTSTIFEPR